MAPDNRRSFVKKSLATSASISFTGLLRAHGEEGGGTPPTDPNQSTIVGTGPWNQDQTTVPWEATVTWEQNQSTGTTVPDPECSIQKRVPDDTEGLGTSYRKTTFLQSDFGLLEITAGNQVVFRIFPVWKIRIDEWVQAESEDKYFDIDCAHYKVETRIELEMAPHVNNVAPDDITVEAAYAALGVFSPLALSEDPRADPDDGMLVNGVLIRVENGPNLMVGMSLSAGYGVDMGNIGQIGPLVNVENQYGRVECSSHGYWLTVESNVTPTPPSRAVSIQWEMRLRKSALINIERHIEAAILNALNQGTIQGVQAANPNKVVKVDCIIPPLPESDEDNLFEQPVFAFDLPSTDDGRSCPVAFPGVLDELSEDLGLEDEPDDDQWQQEDPDMPDCPPLPPNPPIV